MIGSKLCKSLWDLVNNYTDGCNATKMNGFGHENALIRRRNSKKYSGEIGLLSHFSASKISGSAENCANRFGIWSKNSMIAATLPNWVDSVSNLCGFGLGQRVQRKDEFFGILHESSWNSVFSANSCPGLCWNELRPIVRSQLSLAELVCTRKMGFGGPMHQDSFNFSRNWNRICVSKWTKSGSAPETTRS